MNITYTLLLLAAAVVATNSTHIRGAPSNLLQDTAGSDQVQELPNTSRRLLHESSCTLYRKCVTYPPDDEHPKGYHKDSWVCQLSEEDATKMNAEFVDIYETDSVAKTIAHATSGESKLTVSEAVIDPDSPRMFIPDNAHMVVGDAAPVSIDHRTEKRRNLSDSPSSIGTLKTLVIRVKDRYNREPTSTVAKLKNDVFDDAVSLKTQSAACSYGKLNIQPFTGLTPSNQRITNGIVDVKMDYDMTSGLGGMDQAAINAAKEQLGDLNDPRFDLVMFCFPPGKNDFLAFAYPNSKYSFYNDVWCGFSAAQMHEVGHNLGLGHSGETGEGAYGDISGVMGAAAGVDDKRMCYNAQKSYQLGWYENKVQTINPVDGHRREFTLNGVVDYKRNNNALIVMRLKQATIGQDYYIGFNRATGFNSETDESGNMVTIIRKESGGPFQYSQSTKVASLVPGQKMVIKSFDGKRDILVLFAGLRNGDARVIVTGNLNESLGQPAKNHCKKFTIEINTDGHPEDNHWFVVDNGGWGRAAAYSPVYTNSFRRYRQNICLPMGPQAKTYKFTIFDTYKDGMGNGSYKGFDEFGRQIFSGGQNFAQRDHYIQVPKDPNPLPPTVAPTPYPTPKPTPVPPCDKYTVEVITDQHAGDTTWKLITYNNMQDEIVAGQSDHAYSQEMTKYTQEVCLFQGRTYKYKFLDSYGDGICVDSNHCGSYRVLDSCGKAVVKSNGKVGEKFREKSHTFTVHTCNAAIETKKPTQAPTPKPTPKPTQKPAPKPDKPKTPNPNTQCKDRKGRFAIKNKPKARRRNCKRQAKKGKCNKRMFTGEFVRDVCPLSCGVCN